MKVIVSHNGKQHVNALLIGLARHGVLSVFFTGLATNKLRFIRFLKRKWQAKFQKRAFTGIDNDQIKHFPIIALLTNCLKSEYWRTFIAYKWFDKSVAQRLKYADFDIVIGYENINLHSFKVAKQRGKTTVLDMAAIHHNFQNPILTQLGTYEHTEQLNRICAQKEEALTYTDYILTLSSFAEYTLIQSGFPSERIFKTYLGVNQAVFTPKTQYNVLGFESRVLSSDNSKTLTQNSKPETQNASNTEGSSFELDELKTQNSKPKTPIFELYFVGLMTTRKGIPFLLDIHKTLLERGLNVRLTLIGPVDDFTPPTEETPHYRYFSFLNHVELVKMHHDLDLFLFPSYLDSWGQVVIESMACGSPVIVSSATGAKDAVRQGGGRILPVDDLALWVAAVEMFYYDRFLLKEIGQEAAKIAQNYTWEAYQQQVFEALQSISNKRVKEGQSV